MSYPPASKEQKLMFPEYIPEDVINKILLLLPFDLLLRFKSVSKSWLSLISSPNFAKSQLAITNTREPDDQIHIVHSFDCQDESDTSILLVDLKTRQIVADLNFPFSPSEFPYMPASVLVGSVCGIVCVHSVFSNASRIYLWNPATRQSKRIPSHSIRDVGVKSVVLGFGFDPIGNDFKVVRLVSPSFSAEVYSANRNDWRNVKPNPIDFPIDDTNFNVCVNGFLFTAGGYGMIAFDLKTEVFNCAIKFPAPTFDASITEFDAYDPHARITEFNDSIAAIICKRSEIDRKINLWALDDEACLRDGGIQASWTLMLNIDIDQPVEFVNGYFNGGDFLLMNDGIWYLYNSDNEEADLCIYHNEEARNFTTAFYSGQIFRYTKSLFKIAGSKQVNWNAREDDQIHIVHSYNYEDESDTSILLVDLDTRQIVADLNFPFSRGDFPCMPRSLLVGSACGIVCVHSAFSNASRIYLWNPATKQSKRIPLHSIHDNDIRRVVLGFGFEPVSNDFKVVRIVSPSFSAEVYSANRNAWRNVEPNPIDFPNDKNFDVCVNGFLFTAGRYGMIAFDLKTEVFNCAIKFPAPTFDYGLDPHARITEFNDSIAAMICKRSEIDLLINLWALDDEACLHGGGIQAAWTLMLNIDVNQPVQFVHGYFYRGDFLLSNDGVWYLYNSDNEEADLCIPQNEEARNFTDAFYCGQIFRYTKSLFKIAGSKQVNWNAHEDDNEDDN